jgi:DNA-formamidopyrimidine glycosylase
MPEGHTIHRLARQHNELLRDRPVRASSPQGRFADGAQLLSSAVLRQVRPRGKHLFYDFGSDRILHVHLGLYGSFTEGAQPAPPPRGLVRLRLETDAVHLDLRGPTACEVITPSEMRSILARLGPDPLHRMAEIDTVSRSLARRSIPVGAALMDQSVIAGVGNVYRAEVLFLTGISPFRPAHQLSEAEVGAIWHTVRELMRAGVRAGRIVTTRPADRLRRRGVVSLDDAHYVYRRTGLPCRRCTTPVRTQEMAGRNLYWCPTCQPV